MDYTYTVKVIEKKSGDTQKELSVIGFNKANKIAEGLEINLNHDEYVVKIIKQG